MRVVAVFLIACQLSTACTYWRAETLAPADVMEQQYPEVVRVERADGHREVWSRPQLRGDSLLGWWDAAQKRPDRRVPLGDIRQVATSHVSAAKTMTLLTGLGLLAAALIGVASMQGPFDNWGQ